MKKLLAFIIFLPVLLWADPRNVGPTTPDEIYQNDLDLRDMVNSRIQIVDGDICLDYPTLCVNIANSSVTVQGNTAVIGDVAITGDVTMTGTITQPDQPGFLAHKQTTQSNVTGSGETVTINFADEIYDTGGNFSVSTFTAPVGGKYSAGAFLNISGYDSNCNRGIMQLITSNRTYNFETSLDDQYLFEKGIISLPAVDMDANDEAYITLTVSNCSSSSIDIITGSANTYFSMTLVN